MLYEEWLKDFIKDKTLISILDQSTIDSTHDVHRYVDSNQKLWETAITYTGRVIVRSGIAVPDSLEINWSQWETLHHIKVPK